MELREEKRLSNTLVRLEKGDLTMMEVDAFVFYAQPDLQLGSGYGTAISSRGGQSVQSELDEKHAALGDLNIGDVIVSAAGRLKAKHIIHAVGPRFIEDGMEAQLRATMKKVLANAEELGAKTLALPPMGTGFYGVPPKLSAKVMFETIGAHVKNGSGLEEVSVVVVDGRDFDFFRPQLAALA